MSCPLPSLPSDASFVDSLHFSGEFLLCTTCHNQTTWPKPNADGWESRPSQEGATLIVPGVKGPQRPTVDSQGTLRGFLVQPCKPYNCLLLCKLWPSTLYQWWNRWSQELKRVYKTIILIIHYLITEIVSYCSGRSQNTCQKLQLSNATDQGLMNSSSIMKYLVRHKAD